jgi:hypothetical protein
MIEHMVFAWNWKEYRFYVVTLAVTLLFAGTISAVLANIGPGATPPDQHGKAKHAIAPQSLPHGGRVIFPQYSLVALYGSPNSPALGVLGEQPIDASLDRAKQMASQYQPLTTTKVLPSLEIIATTASGSPTDNGDYSRESDVASLLPWVTAAQKAGDYVVLDLQPGRSDFLSQAKQYEKLLRYPNVGLALDPEWRLKPDQVHLAQIGSVDAAEINQTTTWLAELTARHKLPQKLLLIHQFRLDMITNRETLNTSHSELATVIQMDGSGSQEQKQATWNVITQNAPPNVHFGWKNFYKQDSPTLSPEDTMKVSPAPSYVSYQ